jgi:outer membrane protein assembly factor BamB
MKKLRHIYLVVILVLLVCGCSKQEEPQGYNSHGGTNRTNNYEELGSFYKNAFYIDKYDIADKSGCMIPPLALERGRMAVTTVNGTLAMLSGQKVEWIVKLDTGKIVTAGMAGDKDQNIYLITSDGTISSYSTDGKLRWKYLHDSLKAQNKIYSDLLTLKDGLVVAASPGILFKLGFDGKKLWDYNFVQQTMKTFCADKNGNITIVATQNMYGKADTVHYVNSKGKLIWKKGFDKTRILKGAITTGKLIIFQASYDIYQDKLYKIIALDTTGALAWEKELTITPRYISAGTDCSIYFVGYNAGVGESISGIYCFDLKGKMLWKQYLDNTITTPVLVSKENIAVLGVKRNTIGMFFLDKMGNLIKTVSLSDAPIFTQVPFVLPDPVVAFAGSDEFFILRIDDNAVDKILPW